jgi:hypothetical protein
MAFRKVSVPLPEDPSIIAEGFEIPIRESVERWSDITLEDGTTFRAKISIIGVVRVTDRVDAQGNPIFLVNAAPTIAMGIPGPDPVKE